MKLNAVIAAVFLAIILSSCAGARKSSKQSLTYLNKVTEGELSYKSQFRFKYLYFEALRLKATEEFEKASTIMEQCVAIDPLNADAHYELAQLYVRIERINDAIFHAETASELQPNNVWIHHMLSQLYQVVGDHQAEINAFKNLIKIDPLNIEYHYGIASCYARIGAYKNAIKTYNLLENRMGVCEDLAIKKEHVYILMGDVTLAANELLELINKYPNIIQYRGMLAELYHANNLEDLALNTYQEILKIDPKEPRANMALAEHYRLSNNYLKAFEYLNYCFDDPEFDVEVKLQILITYFQRTIEDPSYSGYLHKLINKAIEVHPYHPNIYALQGDAFFHENKSEDAFIAYGKSLDLGATEFLIWNRYLILGLELNQSKLIANRGLKSIEIHPVQPTLYLFTGLALSLQNDDTKAIETLKTGLNYVVNNRVLKAEFFNYLANAYHNIDEHESSDQYFEKCLNLTPENPIVLNNYSYYLSLRSKDLNKAEKLAQKCIELEPNEATYQDTYGWVLYKLGRYKEAEQWISKSLQNTLEPSPEILEHYGDVLFKLNKSDEAILYWKRAIERGANSEKIINKASQGTLYE